MRKLLNSFILLLVLTIMANVTPASAATADTLYDEVYANLIEYKPNFEIQFSGDTKSLNAQLNKVIQDVEIKDRYLYENISNWKISMTAKSTSATIKFQMQYMMTKQEEDFVNAQVAKLLPTLFTANAKDFDKVKAIHDYVVKKGQYSDKTKGSQYSTYTFLTENKGVCQAYALLMHKMLQQAGLDVRYVKGSAGNESHAWNLVKIDNEWFHVDATWNDPIGNKVDQVTYKYFLLTDSQIAKTHTWASAEYPVAKSTKYAKLQAKK